MLFVIRKMLAWGFGIDLASKLVDRFLFLAGSWVWVGAGRFDADNDSDELWDSGAIIDPLEEEEAKRREEEAKLALQSSEVNADQVIAGVNPDQEEATLAQVDIEQVPD